MILNIDFLEKELIDKFEDPAEYKRYFNEVLDAYNQSEIFKQRKNGFIEFKRNFDFFIARIGEEDIAEYELQIIDEEQEEEYESYLEDLNLEDINKDINNFDDFDL